MNVETKFIQSRNIYRAFSMSVRHGKERPHKTGQKVRGDWQTVGCSGPVFVNCSRCGSRQGLSSPRECSLAFVQCQGVETGDWVGRGGSYAVPVFQKNVLLNT